MANANDIHALEQRKTELDEKRKYIVETGSSLQKEEELRGLCTEAQLEYEDRKKRYDTLQRDLSLLNEQLSQSAIALMDAQTDLDGASGRLRSLENRKHVLDSLLANPFNNQQGISSIMDARHSLSGILGVVGQLFTITSGYEEALSTALGAAMNNIVTSDEAAARNAIRFLNRNMSGRATFLPLNVCKPRYIRKEDEIIASNTEGYLGKASDFVACEPRFQCVCESLLGNVLVVDRMESGNSLSALTGRRYKIVTLDGEVIHTGGSMTGGKTKHNTNIVTMKKEAQEIASAIDSVKAKVELYTKAVSEANRKKNEIAAAIQEKRFSVAAIEPVVEAKKAKYDKLCNQLALLSPNGSDGESQYDAHVNDLVVRLNTAYSRKDAISE